MNYFGFPVLNSFRSQTPAGFYDPIKGHTGIDIATPENTALSLPIETQVALVNEQLEMGKTLYLRDEQGNYLVFAHLNSVQVQAGQRLLPNEVFAHSGNTGRASTGPHLHFEIIAPHPQKNFEFMTRSLAWITGYNMDPQSYLDQLFQNHASQENSRPPLTAMDWALEHQIIAHRRDPNGAVTWGEHVDSLQKLAQKLMEWNRPH